MIVDAAEQKGTGRWTAQDALELGVPLTGITEAVFARTLSRAEGPARVRRRAPAPARSPRATTPSLVDDLEHALYATKIVSYAQGFEQMAARADQEGWDVDLGAMATIWRGGCIIRARFLDRIQRGLRQRAGHAQPDGRRLLRRGARERPGPVAARGRPGRGDRRPRAGLQLSPRLLRRLPPPRRPRRPDPGPARPVRRAHLPAQRPRGHLPHRLERRPQGVRMSR